LKEGKTLNWGSLNQSNQHGGQSASAGAIEKKPFREQQLDCDPLERWLNSHCLLFHLD
jgi:hypothetical protein